MFVMPRNKTLSSTNNKRLHSIIWLPFLCIFWNDCTEASHTTSLYNVYLH